MRFDTPYGNVRIAAVEDQRLAPAKHWKLSDDLAQALLLLKVHRETMDMHYLERAARFYHVLDLL